MEICFLGLILILMLGIGMGEEGLACSGRTGEEDMGENLES